MKTQNPASSTAFTRPNGARPRIFAAVAVGSIALATTALGLGGGCNDIDTEDDGDGAVPATVALSSSQCQSCLIKAGKLTCWGDTPGDVTGGTPREVTLAGYPTMVAVAPDHVCALVKDKGVYCWGQNDAGQLGVAIPDPDPAMVLKQPQKSGIPSIATGLSAGTGFTCAIVNGTVKCMGGNIEGTLGNGDFSRSVDPIAVPGLATITEIGSGYAHTCALDSVGDTYCWGANDNGQSGQDKNDEYTLDHAVKVAIPKASRLMIGWETSCAFTDDGLYCWGRNNSGQFGDMNPNDGLPRKVALDGYLDIKPGASRTFGLRQTGTVDYWGLELLPMGEPISPSGISGVNNVSLISAGSNHGCGVTGGNVYCWGDNTCHQLGGVTGDIFDVAVLINL